MTRVDHLHQRRLPARAVVVAVLAALALGGCFGSPCSATDSYWQAATAIDMEFRDKEAAMDDKSRATITKTLEALQEVRRKAALLKHNGCADKYHELWLEELQARINAQSAFREMSDADTSTQQAAARRMQKAAADALSFRQSAENEKKRLTSAP